MRDSRTHSSDPILPIGNHRPTLRLRCDLLAPVLESFSPGRTIFTQATI